jgi:Protein of unknown function (DUF2591)
MMKVSELSGVALDWAVAKCEGLLAFGYRKTDRFIIELSDGEFEEFCPSTDWAEGGPIIEREELSRLKCYGTNQWECNNGPIFCEGPTPLIAAMRCYVASRLGEEIDVPETYLETSN